MGMTWVFRNGNDLGFRLNGFRRAGRHSLSDHQGLRASYAVELRLRWKSAHASRHLLQHAAKKSIFVIAITSQTQRRRYSLLECSGGVSSEHFWIDGLLRDSAVELLLQIQALRDDAG